MTGAKAKHLLTQALKIGFSAAIIVWLVETGRLDLEAQKRILSEPWIIVGLVFVAMNLWVTSERWRLLVRSQNLATGSLEMLELTLIGVFFNYAMPGGVGGDVVKGYYFTKAHPNARAVAITSVVMDRGLGLYAMVMMAVGAMLFNIGHVWDTPVLRSLFYFIAILAAGFTIALWAIFSRRIRRMRIIHDLLGRLPLGAKFQKLYDTAHAYGLHRGHVLGALGYSVIAQTFSILFLWGAGRAAGYGDVGAATYFLVAPLGFMATAIPISPAGVGVGQAAFLFLFNEHLGRETSLGPAVITSLQVSQLLFGLIGALLYVRRGGGALKEIAAEPPPKI